MKRKIITGILLLPLLGLLAFNTRPAPSDEGRLLFNVSYPNDTAAVMGLPDKAVFLFKKQNTMIDFTGMMGLVRLQLIGYGSSGSGKQTFSLMDQKYVSDLSKEVINERNSSFLKSLKPAEGEKKIAGYNCKKMNAVLMNGTTVEVWYTTELSTGEQNWCTPYHDVKGMLMDYVLKDKDGPLTRLTATAVDLSAINDSEFNVPDDFKKVDIQDQEKILKELYPNK